MKITSVEKSKKKNSKIKVYIDDEYAFSISEEDYLKLNLYEKEDITQHEIDHIKNVVNFRSAKSVAIRFLSHKLRTEKEVFEKLERDGYDRETVIKVIDELMSIGYINDKMYVQKYIYDRIKLKPKSKKMVRYELKSRGISEEVLSEVLDDWEIDEKDIAQGLVKKKFGKYNLNDQKIIKKIYSFLGHRGFSYEVISSVLKSINK